MKTRLLLLALPLVLMSSACGRTTPAPERGAPAAGPAVPGSVPASPRTSVASTEGLPALPEDVPTFPGVRAVGGRRDSGPTGAAYTASFEANADAGALLDWYRGRLESSGWTAGASLPATGGSAAFFSKGKRTLLVRTAGVREGVATVTLQESDLTEGKPGSAADLPPLS